ncbi:MAG: glycosyltransferase [Acidiferrobacter sp.]
MLGGDRRTNLPLRILTWHVHGSYLYYLSQLPHQFYVPVKPGRPQGYGGCAPGRAWPPNLHEVAAEQIRDLALDAVIFQSPGPYERDQYDLLTEGQRALPCIYLEHDPPRRQPTDTRHVVDDSSVLLVHVTHFNALMWDSGRTPVYVIRHGVALPSGITFTGEIPRGLVVVNDLESRGRRLGWDVFERVRSQIPLDLVGMGSRALGGLGEIPSERLPAFMARYRFFFNPIRYASLGLAVCEAMAVGVPIIGLATTEMPSVIRNGVSGYVYTDVEQMIRRMRELLARPDRAKALGEGARRYASAHFSLARFASDWDMALAAAAQLRRLHNENVRAGGLNEPANCAYK